ncbi:MAG: hypothetical protein K2O24_07705 [Muribaculaceae bacterium]|nr:hypothetical protein [Muribaculaceae bacterium]
MKRISILKGMLAGMLMASPALMWGGNIPQYLFSLGDAKYVPLTGATVIPTRESDGNTFILPDGTTPNAFTSKGFDLGMKFRLGGREFDRFIVGNSGRILLGEGNVVSANSFSVIFQPVMHGVKKTNISYKTEGPEGKRVFTLQYADCECAVNGGSSKYPGFFDLQFRLYEETGRAEIIFHQPEDGSPISNNGFKAGLMGWDDTDNLFLRGKALREFVNEEDKGQTVYPDYSLGYYPTPEFINGSSFLHWQSDDWTEFTISYVFDPILSQEAPVGSPQNLRVTQNAATLHITCDRNKEDASTVILYSEKPFTEEDYPKNGTTFRAGTTAIIGNATALYYADQDKVSVDIQGVKPGQNYYIKALSATGYPVYGVDRAAEIVYTTTQAAPSTFQATATSATSMDLNWRAENPVIVAVTTKKSANYEDGYAGLFSQPEAEVQPGDILPDGGEIIYVGDASNFTFDNATPNTVYYFRAWTLKEGVVSSTWKDAAAIGTPVLPYEPAIADYPALAPIIGWDASADQFQPVDMDYSKRNAVRAVSSNGNIVSFSSPELPLDVPTVLKFGFALETFRPYEDLGGVAIPQGYEPGIFGTGALRVLLNGQEMAKITKYTGTMSATADGKYETGSATVQNETIELPAVGKGIVTFEFNTGSDRESVLFLDSFSVTDPNSVGIGSISADKLPLDFTQPIYNAAGIRIPATSPAELPVGLYIVGGRKVIIR